VNLFRRKAAPPVELPALPELPVPSSPALDAARAQIQQIVQQATEKVDATIARLRAHLDEREKGKSV
jgi:hypothetical protein